jgi:hypothetical protein
MKKERGKFMKEEIVINEKEFNSVYTEIKRFNYK